MEKPIVFLSHSSRDKKSLSRLREMLIEKTGGAIDFFLSSDGQSIKLGRNWVHKVEEALQKAKIMFVFVTPNSVGSPWMLFESGFAYCKGIRVIPIGFWGTDIGALSPPLSLLQGFNIFSSDGLDNLIVTLNEEFSHKHTSKFTASEFEELTIGGGGFSSSSFGQYTPFIEKIVIPAHHNDGLKFKVDNIIQEIAKIIQAEKKELQVFTHRLHTYGLSISTQPNTQPMPLNFEIDPSLTGMVFPMVETILKAVREKGVEGTPMVFLFYESIGCISEAFKISGRLYGTPVVLGHKDYIKYKDLEFRVERRIRWSGNTGEEVGAKIQIQLVSNSLSFDSIRELIQLLFDREILFVEKSPYI